MIGLGLVGFLQETIGWFFIIYLIFEDRISEDGKLGALARSAKKAFLEVRNLWYVLFVINQAEDFYRSGFWGRVFVLIITPYVVWLASRIKDDDNDRWKRRRRKLASKVKALAGGKLVVVPVGNQ